MFRFSSYIDFIMALLAFIISSIMFTVTVKAPKKVINMLDSGQTEFLFTFRGRYVLDLILSLLLFAMNEVGFILGCLAIAFIVLMRIIGIRYPDAFNHIFRSPPAGDDDTIGTDIGEIDDSGGAYVNYNEAKV